MKHHLLAEGRLRAAFKALVRHRAWLTAAALTTSACLAEVSVPDCVREHNCSPDPGSGGTGVRPPQGGAAGAGAATAGSPPSGGRSGNGGEEAGLSGEGGGADSGEAGESAQGGSGGHGGEGSPECELCLIREVRLDAPCAGSAYVAPLSVQDGKPPFEWQVAASTPGWSITATDPTKAELKNPAVSAGPARITVTATDSQGESTSRVYDVVARDACWFAFTGVDDNGEGELLLFDPIARNPQAATLAHNEAVFDFQFSPDGRYVAYSYGASQASPRGAHLALVDLRTLEDEQLSFGEDSISAFAWAPDSSALALSFVTDGQAYLGAVRLPAAGSSAATATVSPVATFAATELYWIANRFIAYHAPVYPDLAHPGTFVSGADNPAGLRTAFWVELGTAGLRPPRYGAETFPPNVTLRPTSAGFFMVTDTPPFTIFYALGDEPPYAATRGKISLLAPSGLYAAGFDPVTENRLRIDSATGSHNDSFAVSEDDCPLPLAWAPQPERIACVADVWNDDGMTKHGELRFFTLPAAGGNLPMETLEGFCTEDVSPLEPSSCAIHLAEYAYGTDLARKTARAFSNDGRRFAFTSVFDGQAFLYLADLADGLSLDQAHYFSWMGEPGQATRLSFSPDDQLLLFQLGSQLTLMNVIGGAERVPLPDKLADTNKCTEDFSSAPDTYCGDTERTAPWVWAPDSNYLAYQTAGMLRVIDVSAPSGFDETRIPTKPCGVVCSGRFEFQPQP